MLPLDDNFLKNVGLASMPDDQKFSFLQHIHQELERRVGLRLSEGMSDAKLGEIGSISSSQDILYWLRANCPNYEQVVAEESMRLQQEIIDGKDKLLAIESSAI